MVSDLKITVLRVFHPDEVFGMDYPIEKQDWMGSCYMHEVGQEFIVREGELPEGFCSGAWVAIYPHIRLLMMGGNMRARTSEKGVCYFRLRNTACKS